MQKKIGVRKTFAKRKTKRNIKKKKETCAPSVLKIKDIRRTEKKKKNSFKKSMVLALEESIDHCLDRECDSIVKVSQPS